MIKHPCGCETDGGGKIVIRCAADNVNILPNNDKNTGGSIKVPQAMRTFDTGATRDTDDGKFDYEAFISPYVVLRYAEFMHGNRIQKDGSVRDGDNWQKGMPLVQYAKSLIRHVIEFWLGHRNSAVNEDVLCAIMFNVMGYLHEVLKVRGYGRTDRATPGPENRQYKHAYQTNQTPDQTTR